MKLMHALTKISLTYALASLAVSCATSTSEEENLVEENLSQNAPTNQTASTNSATNPESINSADTISGGDQAENFGTSESMNNAPSDEFATQESAPESLNLSTNNSGFAQSSNTGSTNNAKLAQAEAAANALIPTNPGVNSITANSTAVAGTTTNAATNSATTPTSVAPPATGGTVRYVMLEAPVSAAPGGNALETLSIGDHPLVWIEQDHAKLPDGRYVPSSNLSEKGVGRARSTNEWKR